MRVTVWVLLFAATNLFALANDSMGKLWAFPQGGSAHGKLIEPTSVLPLKEKLVQDLAIHDGVIDAVTGPAKADVSVRVLKIAPDSIVIELQNLRDEPIKLKLYQVMQDGRFSPVKSCPIMPGAKSIEVWKEAFDALGFGQARVLGANDELACD
jgi:hypothetical protein